MAKLQSKATLHERAVQKVASENIKFSKSRAKSKRKSNSKVKRSHWSDGVDPRIVKAIQEMHIPQVWRRIQVLSPTEVVILNHPKR